ncbi:uncharacterized protein LOC132591205 [Zootoca vivipara]|uniref:uncharacterized protein LOC132591205 n=1 Tax=Zootoca vivipara TaxID=8524 RepID=UPI00293BCA6C|nr:uncharacterized protein LOC132591205 [Zootoca vivipara]
MERKEQRGGGRRTDAHQEPCEGDPGGTVVQRTQVVLLAGEPWGAESGQQVLSSFAHHVLPKTSGGPQEAPGAESTANTQQQQQQQQQQQLGTQLPPCTSSVAPSGQLTFFLCRAASLRERAARLREVLQGVRDQNRGAPAALVGVIVQPRPEEEHEALSRLEELLREVFEVEGVCPMEIHTAVFAPGRPHGALELRRVRGHVATKRTQSETWTDKSRFIQLLGAALSFGTMAYGGYYFYHHPPI